MVTLLRANLPALAPEAGRWLGAAALGLDLADGRLARARHTETVFGHYADALADTAFWTWYARRHEPSRLPCAAALAAWAAPVVAVSSVSVAFELTGSALGVGAVVFVEIAPVLLFAPFAGAVVDRLPRVQVMIAADLLRAVLAAALIFVDDSVGAVYAIAFGLSVGSVLFNPAANSALPALVEDRELVAANSGIWTAAVLGQIALAPLAGLLYAALGAAHAFGINARELPDQRGGAWPAYGYPPPQPPPSAAASSPTPERGSGCSQRTGYYGHLVPGRRWPRSPSDGDRP